MNSMEEIRIDLLIDTLMQMFLHRPHRYSDRLIMTKVIPPPVKGAAYQRVSQFGRLAITQPRPFIHRIPGEKTALRNPLDSTLPYVDLGNRRRMHHSIIQ